MFFVFITPGCMSIPGLGFGVGLVTVSRLTMFCLSLQVACPLYGLPGLGFGVGLVTVSRLTLCLFVCPMLCCVLFRWVRGVRVSSGLFPFLGWIVCVSCPVAVAIV